MTAYLMPSGKQAFTTATGQPLVGGKIYTYLAGTNTPATTWSDPNQVAPNTNPIILDARGEASIFWNGAYKIVLRDAADVLIWSQDNCVATDLLGTATIALTSGAGLVGFSQAVAYAQGTVGLHLQSLRNIMDAPYNALANGIADDSAAVQAAATAGLIFVPEKTVKTNTAIVGDFKAISFGATFTGAHPLDEGLPAFGPGVLKVIARGAYINGIVGVAQNTAPASTLAFPTGITGYGRNNNNGNLVFGVYGEARQYASTGVACNELDSFNHTAAPSTNLPPDLSIGTAQNHPIALQLGAGGSFNSSIALHITQEGSSPQKFLTGIYLNTGAIANGGFGIVVDALAASTFLPMLVKHGVGAIGFQLQGVGVPVGANAAFQYIDGGGATRFIMQQDGTFNFAGNLISTTVGAAGAAQALPALPSGYLSLKVGGTSVKVPYYAP